MKSKNMCLLVLLLIGLSSVERISAGDVLVVTAPLVRILSNPEKFEGKTIMTVGYAMIEFENSALYLSKEHARARDRFSSVWLADSEYDKNSKYSGRWVLIVGKFSTRRIGISQYCGEFESIRSIDEWPSRSNL